MIDFLINAAVVIVVSGLIGLLIWKLRSRPSDYASIYVDRKDKADFWEGKGAPDRGFQKEQKEKKYEDQEKKCAICGKYGFLGEPEAGKEEVIDAIATLVKNATGQKNKIFEDLEGGHIIPHSWGAPSKDWNLFMICRSHNRKDSDSFTRDAEKLCAERGLKVYLGKRRKKSLS